MPALESAVGQRTVPSRTDDSPLHEHRSEQHDAGENHADQGILDRGGHGWLRCAMQTLLASAPRNGAASTRWPSSGTTMSSF
jgi:hypothetical protein